MENIAAHGFRHSYRKYTNRLCSYYSTFRRAYRRPASLNIDRNTST
jgi:hypothetical protein